MGLYFLESGASFRNSNVVYDREGSSFATLRPGMIDWEKIFADADWFHWSGIAASLSQEGADACLEALQTADRMGLTISCDLNVRKKLWNYGRSVADVMLPLVQYSDVIFGAEPEYKEVFDIAPVGFQAVDTAYPLLIHYAAAVRTEQYAGEQTHFIIAVWAFALFAKLLHPFPCLGVYDRLVVVLENHLLFRGIFYTVLDFVRKFFCLEIYQTACVFPVFKDMHYGIGRPLALIAGVVAAGAARPAVFKRSRRGDLLLCDIHMEQL